MEAQNNSSERSLSLALSLAGRWEKKSVEVAVAMSEQKAVVIEPASVRYLELQSKELMFWMNGFIYIMHAGLNAFLPR